MLPKVELCLQMQQKGSPPIHISLKQIVNNCGLTNALAGETEVQNQVQL